MRTYESYQQNLAEAQKIEAARTDPGSKFFRNRTKGVKGIERSFYCEVFITYSNDFFFIFELDSFSKLSMDTRIVLINFILCKFQLGCSYLMQTHVKLNTLQVEVL